MHDDQEKPLPAIIDLMPYIEGAKMGFSVDDIHAALTNERRLQIARESMVDDHMRMIKRNEVFTNLLK